MRQARRHHQVEHPVFTTKAHVFEIDPETKKKWIPSGSQPVPVSFYFDANKKTHRIIALDSTKILINSTVSGNMTFTKTSPKFGQWSDHRANTVYGLGFATPEQLEEFSETFREAKIVAKKKLEDSKKISTKQQIVQRSSMSPALKNGNGNGVTSPSHNSSMTSPPAELVTSPTHLQETPPPAAHSLSPEVISEADNLPTSDMPPVVVSNRFKLSSSAGSISKMDTNGDTSTPPLSETVKELTFENEQLKLALATSKANAKKLEGERDQLKEKETSQHSAELVRMKAKCSSLQETVVTLTSQCTDLETKNSLLQQEAVDQIKKEEATQQELSSQLEENQYLQEEVDRLSEKAKSVEREKQLYQQSVSSNIAGIVDQLQSVQHSLNAN